MGDENDIIASFKSAWAKKYQDICQNSKKYPHPWQDEEDSLKKQKELQDAMWKYKELAERELKRKNVCLLCGDEVPSNPMICKDCRRVFAAFKTILVEETPTEG